MHARLMEELERITLEERRILDGRAAIDRELYMEGTADTVSHQKLLASGRLIALRGHTRFVHFPPHTHDYIEVVYMCRGRTTHLIDGRKIVLNQGELLFLSQNARQEILPAGADDVAVNFIVLPAFFDPCHDGRGTGPFAQLCGRLSAPPRRRGRVPALCGVGRRRGPESGGKPHLVSDA